VRRAPTWAARSSSCSERRALATLCQSGAARSRSVTRRSLKTRPFVRGTPGAMTLGMTRKHILPSLLLALVSLGAPLLTACWGCEGGPIWHPDATDMAAVTMDAAMPVVVPLTVSAPMSGSTAGIAIEVAMTDCQAGPFDVGVRLARADGSHLTATDGFYTGGG